jgi:histidinol-phosphate aminotransferase
MNTRKSGGSTTHSDLIRSAYRGITLYAPDRTRCRVDLSDNTNLFGAPPAALEFLRNVGEQNVARYPSLYADGLKGAIAAYIGVEPGNIVTGCGSDDVLDSAIRAFCEPGARAGVGVATSDPSFSMIPLHASMNGLSCEQIPLAHNLDINAPALVAAGAAITYICSPNNPTGGAASRSAIEQVLAQARGVVILDEAYAEFTDTSLASVAPATGRLIVARTLSKAFGLAGLRVGYAVGAPELVAGIEKSRGPFKVSSLAESAATLALTTDLEWMRTTAAMARAIRSRFETSLRKLGLNPLPSEANFVLVPVSGAAEVAARMRKLGVAVRDFTALTVIGDALRISVGPADLMDEALTALGASLQ